MNKLKQYKTQIFNAITIFLIVTFVIYPGLNAANTFLNILAGTGFLLLIVWGGIVLYDYVRNWEGLVDKKELSETEQKWKQKKVKTTRKKKNNDI
jgi:uncharacterized membrane protein YbaN (DUF454 family)